MAREVRFRAAARADLLSLRDYVAAASGRAAADRVIDGIEAACRSLAEFPERGRSRDDLRAGARVLSLRRRIVIVYRLHEDAIEIGRVLYRGRDLAAALAEPGPA